DGLDSARDECVSWRVGLCHGARHLRGLHHHDRADVPEVPARRFQTVRIRARQAPARDPGNRPADGRRGRDPEAAPAHAASAAGADDRQQRSREALRLPEEGARPWREVALAALFFLAYTVLATWPQTVHLSNAMADLWDAKLSAWILHWDYLQTFRDPGNLFQAPLFHPAKYVLAFSETFYGAAVFGFPLLAGGASLVFNYNVLLLLGMFLSGMSAWALARYVTNDSAAALVGGVVYAFLPYKLAQLAHFHMEWGPFLPLVFLLLLRYLDGGRLRDAVLLGVSFAWNAITGIQYAFFTGFLIVIVLVLEAIEGGAARRRIGGALLAMFFGFLAFVPFAIPYMKASRLYGM